MGASPRAGRDNSKRPHYLPRHWVWGCQMHNMIAGASLGLVLAAAAVLPARADIAAFNKDVVAGDYKAAAAEAATTWPTLDKARNDIGVIAREFAYAAIRSGSNDQARDLATFAAGHAGPDPDGREVKTGATMLQRLAEHKLAPSSDTRRGLLDAIAMRAPAQGIDNITRIAFGTLLSYDGTNARWEDLRHDAKLAIAFAEAGGKANHLELRSFQLYDDIAEFQHLTPQRLSSVPGSAGQHHHGRQGGGDRGGRKGVRPSLLGDDRMAQFDQHPFWRRRTLRQPQQGSGRQSACKPVVPWRKRK